MGPCVLKGMEETVHLRPRKVLGEGQEDVNVVDKGVGEEGEERKITIPVQ